MGLYPGIEDDALCARCKLYRTDALGHRTAGTVMQRIGDGRGAVITVNSAGVPTQEGICRRCGRNPREEVIT